MTDLPPTPNGGLRVYDAWVSESGEWAVVVDLTGMGRIFNLERRGVVLETELVWDNGGRRVTVHDTPPVCISATYGKGGLAAYSIPTGEVLWRRPEVLGTQRILPDPRRGGVLVVRDGAESLCLDPRSGQTRASLGGVLWCEPSPYTDLCLVNRGKRLYVTEEICRAPRVTLATRSAPVMAACFSRVAVFVAEVAGPLRAYDLDDGRLLWSVEQTGAHWIGLGYASDRDVLHAFRFDYANTAQVSLQAFSPATGELGEAIDFGPRGAGGLFFRDASRVFLYDTTVYDVAARRSLYRLVRE